MGLGDGKVYADFTSTFEKTERLFSIDHWLKEDVVKDV